MLGDARPDLAALFGPQFGFAGYHFDVSVLPPGDYLIIVLAKSSARSTFTPPQVVRVRVR